jgi:hypothetical protein
LYVVRAGLGTPVKQLFLVLDTSTDATWSHCAPCDTCRAGSRFIPASSSSCASDWCPLFDGQPCPTSQDASAPLPTCAFSKPFTDTAFQASLGSDTCGWARTPLPARPYSSAQT